MARTTLSALLFLTVFLAGCAPLKATRGNFLDDDRLKTVQQNVSTKDEIRKTLGSPTTVDPFDDNTWFYIGEKTSTTSFFDPVVEARKVIELHFNKDGILQTAQQVDEKSGRRIDIVTKTTPTPGRDLNAFQQFLGNVGKYNATPAGMGSTPNPGR
jgi:outer membrane protein assembly factor BamE (lipoprotein component of BamABCDE complex)